MHPENVAASAGQPGRPKTRVWVCAAALVWLGAVASGLWVLWAYDNKPGLDAKAPTRWPATSALTAAAGGPTLVFVAHPQCSCTRASLTELAEILARATRHPKTYVLFLKPPEFGPGWEHTDLWKTAAALPNVSVLRDDNGAEAQKFGAETSGQTLLYDKDGSLIYSGGITGSRGHAGENAGELALVALLSEGRAGRNGANVFGCSLFSKADQRF